MEQTIKNMNLVLFNVKNELNHDKNYHAAKTLMNTYRNMLRRFTGLPSHDMKIDLYRGNLENQLEVLKVLHNSGEKNVELLISDGEYKSADNLVETLYRIEKAQKDITSMVYERISYLKRVARDELTKVNQDKRFRDKYKEKLNNVNEDNKEEIKG